MRQLLYTLSIVMIVSFSCQKRRKKKEETKLPPPETISYLFADDFDAKNKWIEAKTLPPILFMNKITMTDGQSSEAGLSFLLHINGKVLLTSCHHLLGTNGGFKTHSDGRYRNILPILKKWEVKSINDPQFIETGGKAEEQGYNDLLFLNTGKIDTARYTILHSTQLVLNTKKYFLLSIDIFGDGQQKLIPFTLLGTEGPFYHFKNDNDEMLEGLSGGPVVTENGNVVGTLNGFRTTSEGKNIVLVQRLRE